jgi:acetolactate synthase-1/2/3 large subunit
MGCALPLAIGYKIAQPGRPVVAFTGDAGLEMALGELATLRDLALPIAVVVFVDRSLGLIELKQRASGFTKLGVDFGGTDFVALAGALGGVGCSVTSASALKKELKEAFTRETFTLIACPIDVTDYEGAF